MAKRVRCSARDTENQNFTSMMPSSVSSFSNSGVCSRNSRYSSSVQKPMTRSTPAWLYQERSKKTISPRAGRWAT